MSFSTNALDNPTYYTINAIHVWDYGQVNVWLEEPADHGCSDTNQRKFTLHRDAIGFEEKFSLLLMSKASLTPVMLGYDCEDNLAVIKRIRSS